MRRLLSLARRGSSRSTGRPEPYRGGAFSPARAVSVFPSVLEQPGSQIALTEAWGDGHKSSGWSALVALGLCASLTHLAFSDGKAPSESPDGAALATLLARYRVAAGLPNAQRSVAYWPSSFSPLASPTVESGPVSVVELPRVLPPAIVAKRCSGMARPAPGGASGGTSACPLERVDVLCMTAPSSSWFLPEVLAQHMKAAVAVAAAEAAAASGTVTGATPALSADSAERIALIGCSAGLWAAGDVTAVAMMAASLAFLYNVPGVNPSVRAAAEEAIGAAINKMTEAVDSELRPWMRAERAFERSSSLGGAAEGDAECPSSFLRHRLHGVRRLLELAASTLLPDIRNTPAPAAGIPKPSSSQSGVASLTVLPAPSGQVGVEIQISVRQSPALCIELDCSGDVISPGTSGPTCPVTVPRQDTDAAFHAFAVATQLRAALQAIGSEMDAVAASQRIAGERELRTGAATASGGRYHEAGAITRSRIAPVVARLLELLQTQAAVAATRQAGTSLDRSALDWYIPGGASPDVIMDRAVANQLAFLASPAASSAPSGGATDHPLLVELQLWLEKLDPQRTGVMDRSKQTLGEGATEAQATALRRAVALVAFAACLHELRTLAESAAATAGINWPGSGAAPMDAAHTPVASSNPSLPLAGAGAAGPAAQFSDWLKNPTDPSAVEAMLWDALQSMVGLPFWQSQELHGSPSADPSGGAAAASGTVPSVAAKPSPQPAAGQHPDLSRSAAPAAASGTSLKRKPSSRRKEANSDGDPIQTLRAMGAQVFLPAPTSTASPASAGGGASASAVSTTTASTVLASEAGVETTTTPLDWSDLAGSEALQRAVEDNVLLPMQHPEAYDAVTRETRQRPETNKHGVFIFEGPPGTGKTTTARILSSKTARPLVVLSFENFGSPFFSESETQLARALEAVQKLEGAILFVDEVDAVFSARSAHAKSSVSHVLDSLLSTFLKFLEGMQGATSTTVILATNRPQVLDAALLSRCGAVVEFPLPNARQRAAIWALYAKQFQPPAQKQQRPVSADVPSPSVNAGAAAATPDRATRAAPGPAVPDRTSSLAQLVAASRGLSGRDIRRVSELVERRHVGAWLRRQEAAGSAGATASRAALPGAEEGPTVSAPPLALYLEALEERREGVLGETAERHSGGAGGAGHYGFAPRGDDDDDSVEAGSSAHASAHRRRGAAGVGI